MENTLVHTHTSMLRRLLFVCVYVCVVFVVVVVVFGGAEKTRRKNSIHVTSLGKLSPFFYFYFLTLQLLKMLIHILLS